MLGNIAMLGDITVIHFMACSEVFQMHIEKYKFTSFGGLANVGSSSNKASSAFSGAIPPPTETGPKQRGLGIG